MLIEKIWTNKNLLEDFFDAENLHQVVVHLEKKYWIENKVICGIYVNGKYIENEAEREFKETELCKVKNLKIVISEVKGLIKENVKSVLERIESLNEVVGEVLQSYRKRDLSQFNLSFVSLVDLLHSIVENLNLLKMTLINNQIYRKDSEFIESWISLEEVLSPTIKELLESFEIKDYVLLSDILEYDLLDIMNSWKSLLSEDLKIT